MNFDAVLIAGPTASGKSSLALKLARDFGGAVINADSMQVYRELRILSARPDEAEQALAPHYLYGFVSALKPFSVGKWLDAAANALAQCREKGSVPLIVGGTGLYFAALTNGLSPIPEIHASIRVEARQRLAEIGNERFHAELALRDPVMAQRLAPGDSQRLVRAWEVVEATGQSLAEWQQLKSPPVLTGSLATFVLKPDRTWLNARIASRFDGMMKEGALDEVRALVASGLDPDLPAARALGVPQLTAHLQGRLSLDEAVSQAVADTRRYAKRQMTWFRHQMPDWTVIERSEPGEIADIVARALE
ncbi:MAG: tRNA (adenosine(37)-N6)-dimethylallyltransferase MiaA [Alphaproteobacteria bacterium]|nr:tRNA (adenosine(37)-N6)-dimethylallyltransferase MiaA [Alphaproteobacteria bacterium]